MASSDQTALRPFRVEVPEAELTELRRRINATRWPDRETVTDQTQGAAHDRFKPRAVGTGYAPSVKPG
jgi:hypothetical protein